MTRILNFLWSAFALSSFRSLFISKSHDLIDYDALDEYIKN